MDSKEFASVIVSAAQKQADEHTLALPGAGGFCTLWETAKPVLESMAGIATYFSSTGAVAGAVLKGLIAIGDQVYGMECGQSSAQVAPR